MTKDVLIKISGLQAMDGDSDDVEIIISYMKRPWRDLKGLSAM